MYLTVREVREVYPHEDKVAKGCKFYIEARRVYDGAFWTVKLYRREGILPGELIDVYVPPDPAPGGDVERGS